MIYYRNKKAEHNVQLFYSRNGHAFRHDDLYLSGWQDSNLRPPRPKRGAITGLRYTPNWLSSK